ncbi:MFS transporter [Psychrobacillus vulpis]|uniref:MFS transporter n=1 Tax=Psychrobacillus vulpis TaxID=2325572 RepID=A0A544TU81_9BACI|nr:MFS transporter [Psychrobacillus vulpis]TQR21005.1 MFS transporter [Psychrobacillus vulpis]
MKLNKNFLFLMLGQSVANIGDVFYIVSIISMLYQLTNSATISAFVPFTITTAMFVSSILTPLAIGKWRLKTLLLGSQIAKTILLFGLSFFVLFFLHEANYYIIFLVIAVIAFLDGCSNPILRALVPYYVQQDQLVKANSIAETITQLIQIGAWLVGGLLLLLMSPIQLVWLVIVFFVLSCILLSFIQHVNHVEEQDQKLWIQLTQGWKSIGATPVLKKIIQMDFLETIAGTVWIAAIVYVFVEQALHVGEQWWGLINGAFFVGLLVGSLFCVKFPQVVENYMYQFIFLGALLCSLLTILFGTTSHPLIALILSAGIGIFGQLKNIPQQTVIQRSVPTDKLVTVYTSMGTVTMGVFGVSSLCIGILADLVGVRAVFVISGLLLAAVSLIAFKSKSLLMKM